MDLQSEEAAFADEEAAQTAAANAIDNVRMGTPRLLCSKAYATGRLGQSDSTLKTNSLSVEAWPLGGSIEPCRGQ